MNRTSFLPLGIMLFVLVFSTAGCRNPSVEEATQDFCESLVAYQDSLAGLRSVSPDTTVGDLKDARRAEQRARTDMQEAADALSEAKLDDIEQAWQELDQTIDRISNQDTLAEVADQIQQGLRNVGAAVEQLGLQNCPDLFPMAAAGVAAPPPAEPITGTQPITVTEGATAPVTTTVAVTTTPVTTTVAGATAPVTTTVAVTTTAAQVPAAPAEAGPAGTTELTGTWHLQTIALTDASILTPSDPALYTLTLQPDGTASVLADCLTGTGTYTVSGDKIAFDMRYSGSMCPPPSIASQYTNYLDYASAYALQDGILTILYSGGAGQMTFAQ